MSDYRIAQTGRASAILTTGEVAGVAFNLDRTHSKVVTIDLNFTLGSLTNVILRGYASTNGTDYFPVNVNGTAMTETLTADSTRCYVTPKLDGQRYFRMTAQGTGTPTNSLCDFTYRSERRHY